MKFNFEYGLIAFLIVAALIDLGVIFAAAHNGQWGWFFIAAVFMGVVAFVLGGLLDV